MTTIHLKINTTRTTRINPPPQSIGFDKVQKRLCGHGRLRDATNAESQNKLANWTDQRGQGLLRLYSDWWPQHFKCRIGGREGLLPCH